MEVSADTEKNIFTRIELENIFTNCENTLYRKLYTFEEIGYILFSLPVYF